MRAAPAPDREQSKKGMFNGRRSQQFHHEDDALDRELNSLVREMEHEEAVRRAVIEMLVMLGSDAALRFDV
jgi:hypothetical protein